MIPPVDSLLKYDNPVLMSQKEARAAKASKLSSLQPADTAAESPPEAKTPLTLKQETEKILNEILPPREWSEEGRLWMQQVSSAPSTPVDVIHLQEQLERKLEQRQAGGTGVCPIRRELYSQCFDELIREVTINCSERGLLLLRVRDEIYTTIAAYQTLYESSVAFGMRKALQANQDKLRMEKKITELEKENAEFKRQVNNKKTEYEEEVLKAMEQRQLQEKKHAEEILILTNTKQQLKAELEDIVTETFTLPKV